MNSYTKTSVKVVHHKEINMTYFETVTTRAVKLEVQLPEKSSSGLYEWIVE